MWCTLQIQTPRYDAHHGARLRIGMHTAESYFWSLLITWLRSGMHTFPVWCTPGSFLKIWISRRNQNRIWKSCDTLPLKGVCHEIFYLHFCSWFEPIWAPDKQAKVFSNSVSISQKYSITKFKKFDSAVCMTPPSKIFSLSKIKKKFSDLFPSW